MSTSFALVCVRAAQQNRGSLLAEAKDSMKQTRRAKTESEMLASFPITTSLAGWYFRVRETSAGPSWRRDLTAGGGRYRDAARTRMKR